MSRPATLFGLGSQRIIWNPDFQATRDDKNLWTGSVSFTCRRSDATSLIPALGSPCQEPGWSFMLLNGTDVSNNEGDTVVVTCKYTGLESTGFETDELDPNSVSAYTKSMNVSTVEEPIETLKKFRDNLTQEQKNVVSQFKAGRAKILKLIDGKIRQLVSIVEDEEVKIIDVPDDSRFQELLTLINDGVETYLVPKPVYRYSYNSRSEPPASLLNDVGDIGNPPKAPSVTGGRNWLLIGVTYDYERTTRIYKITQEWLLSGPGGWDTDVYEVA